MNTIVILGQQIEVPFATDMSLMGRLPTRPRRAEVVQVILHHDACLSARGCFAVLQRRRLSTHFCVHNDGVVFQFEDPAQQVAFHAAGFNSRSIGIDISNAVLTRYADRYTPRRQQATLLVQGRPYTGLVPYPCQIEATLALLRVLRAHFPAVTDDHRTELRHYPELTPETPGIWAHAQISRQKNDPFGFPFERLSEV